MLAPGGGWGTCGGPRSGSLPKGPPGGLPGGPSGGPSGGPPGAPPGCPLDGPLLGNSSSGNLPSGPSFSNPLPTVDNSPLHIPSPKVSSIRDSSFF